MKTLNSEKLLQEVRCKGIEVSEINELIKISNEHKDVVPILLRHLQDIDDGDDKEFLVRCLGVHGFTEASQPLIQEFYKSRKLTFKWTIGNTLSIIQDKNILSELVKIVQEKEHGISRQMFVVSLGKFKNDRNVKDVLISLLKDDDVAGHAIIAIRKIGDVELAEYIEPFLEHKKGWIRNEAKKTIEKFNKAKK